MQSQGNPRDSSTDWLGWRRLAGWLRRSCRALLADLELVDCGSLEVLLYCTDDLAATDAAPHRDRVGEHQPA